VLEPLRNRTLSKTEAVEAASKHLGGGGVSDHPSIYCIGHGQATGSPGTPFELPLPLVQPKYDLSKMGLLEGVSR
jgi:hypothetical protein